MGDAASSRSHLPGSDLCHAAGHGGGELKAARTVVETARSVCEPAEPASEALSSWSVRNLVQRTIAQAFTGLQAAIRHLRSYCALPNRMVRSSSVISADRWRSLRTAHHRRAFLQALLPADHAWAVCRIAPPGV